MNSQLSLNTTSNIVLLLFLDRLKAFQPHFSQFLGFRKLYEDPGSRGDSHLKGTGMFVGKIVLKPLKETNLGVA